MGTVRHHGRRSHAVGVSCGADVVTGKLDVREATAQLPEEPPENEAEWYGLEELAETVNEEVGDAGEIPCEEESDG